MKTAIVHPEPIPGARWHRTPIRGSTPPACASGARGSNGPRRRRIERPRARSHAAVIRWLAPPQAAPRRRPATPAGSIADLDRLGSADWEDRARSELRASGGRVGGGSLVTGLRTLTPQERQVVDIVREGATNRQVAARMYLSPRTIDYHLRNVFTTLDLSSRAQLIAPAPDAPQLASA